MRVLVAQLAPIIGDLDGNLARLLEAHAEAVRGGARVMVAPELAVCGYPPKDLLYRSDFRAGCRRAVETLAAATRGSGVVVVVGAPWADVNAGLVLHDGAVVAVVPKALLPNYDVFDEFRWFAPGRNPGPVEVAGLRLGVTICEDAWGDVIRPGRPGGPAAAYPTDPFDGLHGCDLVVNLSASPFHAGKAETRLALLEKKAAETGAPLVYVNQVGAHDELIFDGGSWVIAPDGAVIHQGATWRPELVLVELARRAVPRFPEREADLHAALVLGIRDYAARSGMKQAVLGLSGGVDSALVAALACEALGPENVLGVGMPGPYSSPGSVSDAEALAHRLGMPFQLLPIGGVHEALLDALAPALAGTTPDVTEENLQARARGVLLMAISNKYARLLLNTGNKSEIAVGYCTLYGDMAGGLAVLGDLYKTEVYALCRWMDGRRPTFPPATLSKPPSAELRPDQTDQDSLPPYPLLDAVLRPMIEEEASPAELVARGFDPALVARIGSLVARAEYKRWQAAPILRVSERAFGSGRRMPLATRWV